MIAIVLPKADDRILGALTFQKNKKFKVYLVTGEADEYPSLKVQHGSWSQVTERYVCILVPNLTSITSTSRERRLSPGRHRPGKFSSWPYGRG